MFWFPGFSVIYALIIELNFHIQNQPYYGVKNKSSIKNVYKKDGGKGTGNKKHKWQVQNRQGEIKNGIGNGEAKELICITHGHELRTGGMLEGVSGTGQRVIKGRKRRDNCNRIINKIIL